VGLLLAGLFLLVVLAGPIPIPSSESSAAIALPLEYCGYSFMLGLEPSLLPTFMRLPSELIPLLLYFGMLVVLEGENWAACASWPRWRQGFATELVMSSGKVPLHLWPLYGAPTQSFYRPALQKQRVELARHPLAREVLARRQPAQEGERARGWVDG